MEPTPADTHRRDSSASHHGKGRASTADDAAALETMGQRQELKRNFSMISMLGFAFAILNTWTALAASITLALPSGGSSSVIWGLLVAGICNLCLSASLAEFLSAYPTAGGGDTTGRPSSHGRGPAVPSVTSRAGSAQTCHEFLIYIVFALIALAINAFLTRLLPYFTKAAFFWSVAGFVIIVVTELACCFAQLSDGQGAFALTGFDATAHMIEEIPDPQRQGPKTMLYCIGIGMFTGFIFLSGLLFCIHNIDDVINASWGPLLQIFMDAIKSKAGSTCLLMFPLLCMVFTTVTLVCTSTRMSHAFARNRGMPFGRFFARVHPTLHVPLNALFWTVG
ncbi:hypothetical protein EsHS_00004796 [Epichloe bromicola]